MMPIEYEGETNKETALHVPLHNICLKKQKEKNNAEQEKDARDWRILRYGKCRLLLYLLRSSTNGNGGTAASLGKCRLLIWNVNKLSLSALAVNLWHMCRHHYMRSQSLEIFSLGAGLVLLHERLRKIWPVRDLIFSNLFQFTTNRIIPKDWFIYRQILC